MPDAAVTTPKKRGPRTPEGKACSAMNALKHGLRARDFVLLPEEDPDEWTQYVLDLEEGYGPVDATEKKLVDAIAPSLRARLARLLDRDASRLPEELDLAEAVCALKWPKWPTYRGAIDLGLLRRALDGTVIDDPTLNWLGGKEIVRECRAAAAAG